MSIPFKYREREKTMKHPVMMMQCSKRWKLESKVANSLPHYGVNKDPVSLHFEEWLFPGAFSCLCYNNNRNFWKSWPQYEVMKMLSSLHFENSWFLHWLTSNSPASVTAITQEILKSRKIFSLSFCDFVIFSPTSLSPVSVATTGQAILN
jgi:hypothetical protein